MTNSTMMSNSYAFFGTDDEKYFLSSQFKKCSTFMQNIKIQLSNKGKTSTIFLLKKKNIHYQVIKLFLNNAITVLCRWKGTYFNSAPLCIQIKNKLSKERVLVVFAYKAE